MEILSNHIIEIENSESERKFIITKKGKKVGFVEVSDKSEIYFEIDEDKRQNHYASNALFVLMPYIHKELHEPIIHAVIPVENEMAIHVVEHNGYEIISRDEKNIYYEHRIYETRLDDDYVPAEGLKVMYLAGGCFWGMERAFKELNGVVETKVGYANGHVKNPTYEEVCRHETGFRECIRVTYNPEITSADTLLKAYFICVDPTQSDGQGGDIGEQYLLGIYYKDDETQNIVTKYLEEEKNKYPEFHVENKKLDCFYEAEEYHQDYLLKNPSGYCHITRVEMDKIKELN
jgi:methionine-S-sulfoxide reductase